MAVRLTLQRALLGAIAAALLVGLVPAAIALDKRVAAALIANAQSDLEMAPGVLADRTTSHATMLSMHAQDFARSAGLAAALVRHDTADVRRLADSARPSGRVSCAFTLFSVAMNGACFIITQSYCYAWLYFTRSMQRDTR